jgi:hypothetical protein
MADLPEAIDAAVVTRRSASTSMFRDALWQSGHRSRGSARNATRCHPAARRHASPYRQSDDGFDRGSSAPLVSAFKIQGNGGEMLTPGHGQPSRRLAFKVRATPLAEARMVSLYSAMLLESSPTPMP